MEASPQLVRQGFGYSGVHDDRELCTLPQLVLEIESLVLVLAPQTQKLQVFTKVFDGTSMSKQICTIYFTRNFHYIHLITFDSSLDPQLFRR